jgi:hypothetical protein
MLSGGDGAIDVLGCTLGNRGEHLSIR